MPDIHQILLVDDEEDIREVLRISLADFGYSVDTAESGEAALTRFSEKQYPIVLCDIKMPGMDGIELLQKIKETAPDTEVIMITGHGDMDLAIRSLKLEATDFVKKPINDDVLEIALKRARERIEMRSKIRSYTENLERMVEEKTRRLLEAERMAAAGETVAGLSHAVKNIAGTLRGGMFVLEKGLELENREYLENGWNMIKGNVEKIRKLSLDLLRFAQEPEIRRESCNPNRPVREVLETLQSEADAGGVSLEFIPDDTLPPVSMDVAGIARALLNIVENALHACRYTEEEAAEKRVVVETGRNEDGGIFYRVTDTGIGIGDESMEKLFQSFFTTKGTKGTGIGLMIAKRIIDRHDGTIEVASEKNNGTVVTLHLPLHPPVAGETPSPTSA